jgi:hypothetical protein
MTLPDSEPATRPEETQPHRVVLIVIMLSGGWLSAQKMGAPTIRRPPPPSSTASEGAISASSAGTENRDLFELRGHAGHQRHEPRIRNPRNAASQ